MHGATIKINIYLFKVVCGESQKNKHASITDIWSYTGERGLLKSVAATSFLYSPCTL